MLMIHSNFTASCFPTVHPVLGVVFSGRTMNQMAHDLGFAPAPVSHQRVEDKNQALQFAFEDKTVRTIFGQDREPWFAAQDVCNVLGYADTDYAVRAHCKYAKLFKAEESPGMDIPPRGMMFINEPDLYRLIVKSTKPAAERFERMVMEEILPSIRKHGGYLTPQATEQALADPDFIIAIATKLKE
jgi:anti-repressor protein